MNRVHIKNQIGTKGICGGPLSINREPPGLNYGVIQDWNVFCDEVDEVLKAATRLRNIFQIGSFVLITGLFIATFVLGRFGILTNSSYIFLLLSAVLFVNIALYVFVLKRYNTVMTTLGTLVQEKSSNTVRYELQKEDITLILKRYFLLVHGVNDDDTSIESDASSEVYSISSDDQATTLEDDPQPSSTNMTSTLSNTVQQSSTTDTNTITNTNNGAGTTSIFDQLNSRV